MLGALKLPASDWFNRAGVEQPLALERHGNEEAAHFAVMPWRGFADPAGWDALAARAAEPNPFAERWCLEPGLAAFDPKGRVELATLVSGGALVGALPLTRSLHYERYPFPHIGNWLHANAFCGMPLPAAPGT